MSDPATAVIVRGGRYAKPRGDEEPRTISNFVLIPRELIQAEDGVHTRVTVRVPGQADGEVTLAPDDWTTRAAFTRVVGQVRGATWSGAPLDHQAVKAQVQNAKVPLTRQVRYVGMVGRRVLLPDGPAPRDEGDPIRFLPRCQGDERLLGILEARPDGDPAPAAAVIAEALSRIRAPEVAVPAFGWLGAAPFRHVTREFPILAITGEPGAGKTTLARVMRRIAGLGGPMAGANDTEFVLIRRWSVTNLWPIVLDEFKPQEMRRERLHSLQDLLRRAYGGDVVGRGTSGGRVDTYHLSAPAVLCGEGFVHLQALRERVVPVVAHREDVTDEGGRAVDAIVAADCRSVWVAYALWCHRDGRAPAARAWSAGLREWTERVTSAWAGLAYRQRHNLAVACAGWDMLGRWFEHAAGRRPDPTDPDDIAAALGEAAAAATGRDVDMASDPLGAFLEVLSVMAGLGEIHGGREYEIRGAELRIRFPAAYDRFCEHCRRTAVDGIEHVGRGGLRRLIRSRQGDLVVAGGRPVRFGPPTDRTVRADCFDIKRALAMRLDLSGFGIGEEIQGDL